MSINIEILEPSPNVKLVRDSSNRSWLCDASASSSSDLHAQGCVLFDEIVYDRDFGG
jgi:hypothetical protein